MFGPGNNYIRTLAVIVTVLGLLEIITGSTARNIAKHSHINYFGAWWVGLVACIGGLFGVIRGNKNLVGCGYCFSIATIIVAIIGMITDSVGKAFLNRLDTCVNANLDIYGSTKQMNVIGAKACFLDQPDHDCSCFINEDEDNGGGCYYFDLNKHPYACSQITEYYPKVLNSSIGLCVWIILFGCIWSVWVGTAICCGSTCAPSCPMGCCDISAVDHDHSANTEPLVSPNTQYVVVSTQDTSDNIGYTAQTGYGGYTVQPPIYNTAPPAPIYNPSYSSAPPPGAGYNNAGYGNTPATYNTTPAYNPQVTTAVPYHNDNQSK